MPASPDPVRDALSAALGPGYALERELGRGGMGIVYLARDLRLDRAVAVKVLPPGLSEGPGGAEMRDRFLREARTAAQLAHPNIVPVHRADEAGGLAFFVMGFVDGETLADHVAARGALPVPEAVRWLREAAWALAYAHARGIVHRDVKPENIMVERGSGRVLVTDFGIARRAQDARLTADGHILGSVHFMSPEQIAGGDVDGRSDLYALGVVGFHLLSGRLPFAGPAPAAVLLAHATTPAPPLRSVAPQVPEALALVIDRCLAKEPAARYATGEALADALGLAMEAADAASATGMGAAPVLSEAQAAAVWRRAAQLQVEAAQRLEARTRAAARTQADAEVSALAPTSPTGYRVRDVEAAAVEAGISQQYVALALAELATPAGGVQAPAPVSDRTERLARFVLRDPMRSMSVSRTVAAAPKRVLAAMGQVLQAHPFGLVLKDTVGGHPLDGGILVFELPPMPASMSGYHWMYVRYNCYATQIRATLRALPGVEASELTLTVDVQGGWPKNLRDSGLLSAMGGVFGGALGVGIGVKALAVAGALVALPAAAGALLGVGAVAAGMGPLYRWGLGKARTELEAALTAVTGAVRSQDVFGAPPPVQVPPPASSSGDAAVIVSMP